MKTFVTACIFFCMTTFVAASEQAPTVYDRTVLTEDATWRGFILVKGFVVVANQATLRIEPGTVVRFAAPADRLLPNLVVQGRLHASGTADLPIILTTDGASPTRGSWGGIVFLSTEKRNFLEQCRIEYAATGIDVWSSSVSLKNVSIRQSHTALLSHDGVVQIIGGSVSDSETGIEIHNSEFDSKDMSVSTCERGCVLNNSSVVLAAPKIMNNRQTGLEADECRFRITDGEFSGNTSGARIRGGEGQVTSTVFQQNRQTALNLIDGRAKVTRCVFTDNSQDALRTEDGQVLLLNNAFVSNGGYNLYNVGVESVAAWQNWWGSSDQALIGQKILDSSRDKKNGTVHVFPWLSEKPRLMP